MRLIKIMRQAAPADHTCPCPLSCGSAASTMSDTTTPTHGTDPASSDPEHSGTIVSLYQKHRKIYARAVTGVFARWRWALVWATQLLFYGLPWLNWNDRQGVLFELVS